jgi:hypothetical protein
MASGLPCLVALEPEVENVSKNIVPSYFSFIEYRCI